MNKRDQRIIKGIRKGNLPDFKSLYDTYYRRMVLYSLSYIENKEIAEDIVQDVFLKLWEKRKDAFIVSSVDSYLFRAVHNACIQYFRHNKVTERYENQHKLKLKEIDILYHSWNQNENTPADFNEIKRISERTLYALPEKTREIFSLSRQDQLTNKEISQKILVDIKTVEYHIGKALKAFRENLKDYLMFVAAYLIF
jgi:RNA polymerase sigma-70 factor, ECF subfamily